jgi:ubiquinone/menaquinone biosynthesis C-methylase UbiE
MSHTQKTYLPAAGRDWALPLYDPFVKLLGFERATRPLLEQAGLQPGHRVLDIGCGTGTLALLISRLHPNVEVTGLDPDPKALARARRKAQRAAVSIQFDVGFSEKLPYGSRSFDRVFSTFMFHHLGADQKEATLREVRRVLSPGGSFHMLDFSLPEHHTGALARLVHSSDHFRDNSESKILGLLSKAEFADSRKIMDGAMLFGAIRTGYYLALV